MERQSLVGGLSRLLLLLLRVGAITPRERELEQHSFAAVDGCRRFCPRCFARGEEDRAPLSCGTIARVTLMMQIPRNERKRDTRVLTRGKKRIPRALK